MNSKTRKLTTTGMLCALAYTAAAVGRIPIILFFKVRSERHYYSNWGSAFRSAHLIRNYTSCVFC